MKPGSNVFTVAIGAVFLSACGDFNDQQAEDVATEQGALNQTFAQHQTACQADPRVQSGVVSLTECIGADIFFKENFNGNGRTCGSCHRVERNFTIDATFIARLPSSDPLFIAENHTDTWRWTTSRSPPQMRARGLILENVDGTQPEGPTVRFVLRACRTTCPRASASRGRRVGRTRRRTGPAGAVTARPSGTNAAAALTGAWTTSPSAPSTSTSPAA